MSLLRICAPLGVAPARCQWALIGDAAPLAGEGTLAELPRGAQRVQLVIPAAHALLTRAKLPPGARRGSSRCWHSRSKRLPRRSRKRTR